jgi:hypothetical protein
MPQPLKRPSFNAAWGAFTEINLSVKAVGQKLGGKVQQNIDNPGQGAFTNACPIRMSYVLNRTGFPVRRNAHYAMVSGADHMWYIFHVEDMMKYLEERFGKPDKHVKSPSPTDFKGMKGLLVIKGHGWDDAKGHITIWNGTTCSDHCHLSNDPDNGTFMPETGAIWVLK